MINPSSHLNLWYEEQHRGFVGQRFRVTETLFHGVSPYQRVEVLNTAGHGKMLVLDGLVMISERDEFIYHDMITHVPLFTHPNPRRILVIGGGDGGTVREALRHERVRRVVLVEIDPMVVDVSQRYLPQTSGYLEDPRVEVRIEDGVKYVAQLAEKDDLEPFDVVLVDSTDPIGPATPLFGASFYQNVHKVLASNGIVVSQGESPFYEAEWQKTLVGILGKIFPRVTMYNYCNLTYPGGLWSFSLASKGLCPLSDFDPKRVRDRNIQFGYYTPEIHRASFALPRFQQDQLEGLLTPPKHP